MIAKENPILRVSVAQAVQTRCQALDHSDLRTGDPLGDDRESRLLQRVEDELELLPIVHRQPAHPSADIRLELDQTAPAQHLGTGAHHRGFRRRSKRDCNL